MHTQILLLIGVAGLMFLIIGGLAFISHYYTLNGIKSKCSATRFLRNSDRIIEKK